MNEKEGKLPQVTSYDSLFLIFMREAERIVMGVSEIRWNPEN